MAAKRGSGPPRRPGRGSPRDREPRERTFDEWIANDAAAGLADAIREARAGLSSFEFAERADRARMALEGAKVELTKDGARRRLALAALVLVRAWGLSARKRGDACRALEDEAANVARALGVKVEPFVLSGPGLDRALYDVWTGTGHEMEDWAKSLEAAMHADLAFITGAMLEARAKKPKAKAHRIAAYVAMRVGLFGAWHAPERFTKPPVRQELVTEARRVREAGPFPKLKKRTPKA